MDKDKILHVVGGAYNQIPLVRTAHNLGLKVLVTDPQENPPCRSLADYYERIDTTDKHATFKIAEKYNIGAIVTDQMDASVPTVAYVAESMKLEGIGYETALRFTNKFLARESLKGKLKEYIPEYFFFDADQEAFDFCKSQRDIHDYIVKPINSQGSKGVCRLNNANYQEAVSTAFLESRRRGVLIEKFIKGFEYSVEAYKEGNVVYNLAVTKKYHYDSNGCIDERNTWLGDISQELEEMLFDLNKRVIEQLKLPFGITHSEFKVSEGRPYLIEVHARGGGGSISNKIIPYLTGFEPAKALLCKLIGNPVSINIEDYKRYFAVLKFFNFRPGKVKKIHLHSSVIENLMEFHMDVKEGGLIKNIKDSRDRPGYFIVSGEDRQEVIEREKWIEESVIVEYEKQ